MNNHLYIPAIGSYIFNVFRVSLIPVLVHIRFLVLIEETPVSTRLQVAARVYSPGELPTGPLILPGIPEPLAFNVLAVSHHRTISVSLTALG